MEQLQDETTKISKLMDTVEGIEDLFNYTPLMAAANYGNNDLIEYLLVSVVFHINCDIP